MDIQLYGYYTLTICFPLELWIELDTGTASRRRSYNGDIPRECNGMEGATRRTMRRALYGAGGGAGHDVAAPDEAAARPGCSERTSHAENGPQRAEAFDAAGEGAADLGAADLDVEERLPLPSLFSLQSLLRLLSLPPPL